MNFLRRLGRRYKRYRSRHRYDKPVFIFLGDTVVALLKNFPLLFTLTVTFGVTMWFLRYSTEPTMESPLPGVEANVATEQTKEGGKYVKIGGYNAWVKAKTNPGSRAPSIDGDISSETVIAADNSKTTAEEKEQFTLSDNESPNDAEENVDYSRPQLVNESWILGLKSTSYVIQFSSSAESSKLEDFIPVLNIGEPIAIDPFRQTPTAKTMHGIATGVYETPEDAFAAIGTFSEKARAHDPWVRKVSDLVDQIENVNSTPRSR